MYVYIYIYRPGPRLGVYQDEVMQTTSKPRSVEYAIRLVLADGIPPAVSPRVSRGVHCTLHSIPEYDIANDGFPADSAPPRPPRQPTRTPARQHHQSDTTADTTISRPQLVSVKKPAGENAALVIREQVESVYYK